jgi:tetratricopeptide (TPR) repeat protein
MSSSESRSAVVLELAEEFLGRYRQGQRPSLKEYADRHPDLATEIREVFPAMALMENIALADESLAGGDTPPGGQPPPQDLQQLGDFRILREVGHGGMGIVYEAEQVSLSRHVALKVLTRKMLLDARQRRRFEREARAAAKLHHTNIVPVFGVGEQDGLPYYVMQFIQGLGLDEVLDELKRIQGGKPAGTGSAGDLRVSHKDVSAVDVARSLMTGEFHPAGDPDEPSEPPATGPTAPESGGRLSGSFTLSSSSVTLPGPGKAAGGKARKLTYWQSVARVGVQVAEALAYAHGQGILHRDVKPSNLLLDTAGTVWVADFGLARAEEEEQLTHTGDIVGTLRYMPPEAFEGRADARGDLYSLGLTLYELAALRPAFEEKDRNQLIKRVTTEEPPRLDRLNPQAPRDLVTIVHKAIDREPGQRYPSAAALAADLQRFLDDEPIQARRTSARERLWRWCRHHPGVGSLTAALVLILVGVTLASVLAAARFDRLAREQAAAAADERQARQAADEAKEHEAALRQQAEEAKRQAEANFAQARKAVDDSFTKVSESQLLKVSGMQPLRRELLQSALAFYQDFLKERGDDPALRGDLAAAYLRVGNIRSELGEGAEARKAWEQARELYEALTKAAPESVEWRHGLADCYLWLGRNDEAVALWEKLVQPGLPRFQKELADAYNSRAIGHANAGRRAEALQAYQQSLAIREMLVRLEPEDADAQRDLGATLNNIGVLLGQRGQRAEALVMYRRAAEHGEVAFARAPQVILNGRYLAIQQGNIADVERQLGHPDEALAAYRRVVEVWRKLARDNPAVPYLHSSLFGAYRVLAEYQRELKQTDQAERTMRLARAMIDQLPGDSRDDLFKLACFRALCSTYLGQGKGKPTAEDVAEQKHEADLAVEALRKAIAAGYKNLDQLRNTTDLNALRGREDFKALETDLAARAAAAPTDKLKASEQALALRQKAAQADPKSGRLRADLAASQHAIALVLLDLGKPDEAQKHLQQAITLRAALVKDEPNNAHYQTDLALSRFALGDSYWQSGRLAEGAKAWQQNRDVLETAARGGQDRSSLSGQLLTMRRTVAQHYARAGLWPEAAAHYERLIQLEEADYADHYRTACLALRAGDAAAYRSACEVITKRFSERQGFWVLGYLTWACVLADGAAGDPSTAVKRAKAMTSDAKEWQLHMDWQYHLLGLAHYRAGQFAEAIAATNKSEALGLNWPAHFLNWPVLAMAHHRLGHTAEARQWLEKSTQEWRRLSPVVRSPDGPMVLPSSSGHWTVFWHDWPTFEILLREASVLIMGAPPVEDAYDHAHRSLLYLQLGESAKAEAEWQAAVKVAPKEPALWIARGRVFAQVGQREKAEADFARAVQLKPDDAELRMERGRLYFELGQTDKAAADFRKAVSLLDDKPLEALLSELAGSETAEPLVRLADDAVLQKLTAAVERTPEDASKHWQRGNWHARHRRWKEAAADFTAALQRQPTPDAGWWLHAAPALVAVGDHAGYRRLCREMLQRFGETQVPSEADATAKTCLLLPAPGKDTDLACRLADRAALLGRNDSNAHWIIFGKGLADYRRGNYPAAIARLDPLVPQSASLPELTAECHLVLAMAHHRQGEAQAAREHLARAGKLLDQYLSDPALFPNGRGGYSHDWLIAWLLHREARALIVGKNAGGK